MILVTGATGNIGGKVLARLRAAGHPVRALTRDPDRAQLPTGIEVVGADLGRPETLPAALDGVRKVFLMSLGADKTVHDANLVAAAGKAGVQHIVQLSTLGVETAAGEGRYPIGDWHRSAEEALRASAVPWTILRPNGFMSMAFAWAPSIRAEGVVRAPVADVPEAVVDPRDVAEAAARVLTSPGHEGAVYSLTGPAGLTVPQQVEIVGQVLGRTLRFETVTLEEQREVMLRYFSAETVDGVIRSIRYVIESGDRLAGTVFDDVRRLLGRAPRSLREWAEDHKDAFLAHSAAGA
ncbi:SDR family oxidoreductase [Streptantibioticus rubrisoli]|uniref:SDR family oxidoreductase n=1 Tax=Streptantibioticus rubrisoli TaxID=1387313 RepID=A0ABT1PGN2_9ACTN|nr:SDR family oxidoreductase [Streptantibioticus rubrisoli]MCQ4044530.1 SDR family oxidoreductase [Streptantibioticus rubrisoli]